VVSILGDIAETYQGVQAVLWQNPVGENEFSGQTNELILLISLPP